MNADAKSVRQSSDVAIVGLGPTGAALANLLGLHGLSVAVFEREAVPLDLPRAIHFDGEVMRIFQAMGLASALEPHLRASTGLKYLNVAGQMLLERKPANAIGPHGWADNMLFHQPDLEATLRHGIKRFPAIEVFLAHEVECLTDSGTDVTLRVRDCGNGATTVHRARWVVGCDGGRSLVRNTMNCEFDDFGLHQPWLVVDMLLTRDDVDLPDMTVQYCDPMRPITFVRGVGRRRRWEIMLMPGDDPQTIATPEAVWDLLSHWVKPDAGILQRRAIYTFHSLIAKKWRDKRLLLAGDSAHQTPPFLGQGLCTGIRDAANLAWKLALVVKGQSEIILDSYESERRPHAQTFITSAVELGGIIQTTDPIVASERDAKILAGEPLEMVNLSPPLGPGLHRGAAPAGTILSQPRLSDGTLLDDAIGNRFAVIGNRSIRDAMSADERKRFDALDAAWIDDPALVTWLAEAGAKWIVLRPDRYVFGTATDAMELGRLAADLPIVGDPSSTSDCIVVPGPGAGHCAMSDVQ